MEKKQFASQEMVAEKKDMESTATEQKRLTVGIKMQTAIKAGPVVCFM